MDPIQSAPQSDQQPTPRSKGAGKSLVILMIVALMAISAILGFMANDYISNEVANNFPTPLIVTPKPEEEPAVEVVQTQEGSLPAVVFTPGGLFNEALKAELNRKVVNPMKDYELSNISNPNDLVAIVVEKLQPPSAGYIYSISSYYQNNGSGGFLYGNEADGSIPIWIPDCMGKCQFTESYSQKYPEVIEAYNQVNQ